MDLSAIATVNPTANVAIIRTATIGLGLVISNDAESGSAAMAAFFYLSIFLNLDM